MKPQVSACRRDGGADYAPGSARLGNCLRTTLVVLGDALLAVGIVAAALIAWSPRIGIAAARETLAARRAERSRIAEIERSRGKVWARHARREMRRVRGNARVADELSRSAFDP